MNSAQNAAKYVALALGILLAAGIIAAIISALFGISAFFGLWSSGEPELTDFSQSYEDISEIDIYSFAGEVRVLPGDEIMVEAVNVYEGFSCTAKGDKLSIKNRNRVGSNVFKWGKNSHPIITVYLPDDLLLSKLRIENGAGKISAESINTYQFILESGAGACYIDSLEAEMAELKLGVGEVSIESAVVDVLDLEAGVGRFYMKGRLNGDAKIEGGVGEAVLVLLNEPDEHSFDIEGGIGAVEIDGNKVSQGRIRATNPIGVIDIEGGIGKISIDYE